LALTEGRQAVASASFDGTVRLWSTATSEPLVTMHGHEGRVVSVALDAGGRLVASAGVDGTVRIWEGASGTEQHALRADRSYERLDITDSDRVTEAQREALLALGAVDEAPGVRPLG